MDPAAAPPVEEKKEAINIKVKGADGNEIYFKIKPTTQLQKVFDAYYERNGLTPNSLRFTLDGTRINGNQTAESLKLQNEDTIEVQLPQTGG